MFYLWIRPRSTCFTTKGSKQSLSPLAITTWRWHAGPLSLGSPTSFTSSANIGLNILSQCSPSRNMFHQAKGIKSWKCLIRKYSAFMYLCWIHSFMQSLTLILFEGIKGKPATPLGSRRSLWLMITLMDTSVTAVRVPDDNALIIQAEHTCLYFSNWVYPLQRRKATVTVRALEAVWNLSQALVSSQLS